MLTDAEKQYLKEKVKFPIPALEAHEDWIPTLRLERVVEAIGKYRLILLVGGVVFERDAIVANSVKDIRDLRYNYGPTIPLFFGQSLDILDGPINYYSDPTKIVDGLKQKLVTRRIHDQITKGLKVIIGSPTYDSIKTLLGDCTLRDYNVFTGIITLPPPSKGEVDIIRT